MTFKEFADENGLDIDAIYVGRNGDGFLKYDVELLHNSRECGKIPWFAGRLVGTPDAATILICLILDYHCGQETFEDFCSNCGYDEDSREAYCIWEQCRETEHILKDWLDTNCLDELLSCEE